MINLRLGVDEVVTLTTLAVGQKGKYADPPHNKPFPVPYKEDFEGLYILYYIHILAKNFNMTLFEEKIHNVHDYFLSSLFSLYHLQQ